MSRLCPDQRSKCLKSWKSSCPRCPDCVPIRIFLKQNPDGNPEATLSPIMSNNEKIAELRKTAESHRKWASHCLSIERNGWLTAADDCDHSADQLQQESDVKIHITKFVRRQTPASAFSHWTVSDEELLARVQAGLPSANPGYRDGVILVPISPDGFFSGLVRLKEGDLLIGEFKARRPGEEPRKQTYAMNAEKIPAKSVYIVLYSHAVLAEGKENETDADYEIVSVNGSPEVEETPITSSALIANHFNLSGGTSTKMSDADFVAALRKSIEFWKDKALACPKEVRDSVMRGEG